MDLIELEEDRETKPLQMQILFTYTYETIREYLEGKLVSTDSVCTHSHGDDDHHGEGHHHHDCHNH